MKWEFMLSNESKSEFRKQMGDIVAIRAYPWDWGLKEISKQV